MEMVEKERMVKGQWAKGRDSALGVPLAAGLRPASRPVGLVVCGAFRRAAHSFLLLQELSKERVIELVSAATCADEESSLS